MSDLGALPQAQVPDGEAQPIGGLAGRLSS